MAYTWEPNEFPKKVPLNEMDTDRFSWKSWFRDLYKYLQSHRYGMRVGSITGTAQTATLAATTIYAVPTGAEGYYRVEAMATVTTAGSVSSTLGTIQIVYTDPLDSLAKTTANGGGSTTANTTGTACTRHGVIYAKEGTNIQVIVNYTDGGGAQAMTYAYRAICTYLGP